MRKPLVAGNWKMSKTQTESVEFVRAGQPVGAHRAQGFVEHLSRR